MNAFEDWCDKEYPKLSGPFQSDAEMCFSVFNAGRDYQREKDARIAESNERPLEWVSGVAKAIRESADKQDTE